MDDISSKDLLLVLLGVVLGLIVWWVQSHVLTPNVDFSDQISKKKNAFTGKGWMYRIKLNNNALRRAIDVSFHVKYSVRSLHYKNRTWITIPATPKHVTVLGKRTGNRILRLRAERIKKLEFFPPEIQQRLSDNQLTIEELLALDPSAIMQVFVFAYDEFSGARKMFQSKEYKLDDIREGKFNRNGLDVVPDDAVIENWAPN